MSTFKLHLSTGKRAIALSLLTTVLIACGPGGAKTGDNPTDGGGGGGGGGGFSSADFCKDSAAGFESPVVFNPSDSGGSINLYSKGATACFTSSSATAIRSNVGIEPGSGFYYFEAKVGSNSRVGVGSSTAPLVPVSGTAIERNLNSVFVDGGYAWHMARNVETGVEAWDHAYAGETDTIGFAVDYRYDHPVVYVVNKNPADNSGCRTENNEFNSKACAFIRTEMEHITGTLYIYAWGTGSSSNPGFVNINTGTDLTENNFTYAPLDISRALRSAFYRGDQRHGSGQASDVPLVAQWARPTPDAAPVVTRNGYLNVVTKINETGPYRTSLSATATDAEDGSLTSAIKWVDEKYNVLGTGGSLAMTTTLFSSLGAGDHVIEAVATDKEGMIGYVDFHVHVVATTENTDDDHDGLTYIQEKALQTDPGNPDTDGDGLSDAVESTFGFDATNAYTNAHPYNDGQELSGDHTQESVKLVIENGSHYNDPAATSRGVVVSEDGYQAAFTRDMNLDCVNKTGDFASFFVLEPTMQYPIADSSPFEMCLKRAIRANGGIKQGEFRYFEVFRLLQNYPSFAPNLGQGLITPQGKIDPYCCVASSAGASLPDPIDDGKGRTPPSMSVNSLGSVWNQLVGQGNYATLVNFHTGFAVDYRGATPIVYVFLAANNFRGTVWHSSSNTYSNLVTDNQRDVITNPNQAQLFTRFGVSNSEDINVATWDDNNAGEPVIPFVYGHPVSDNDPGVEINFGLKRFHYDISSVVIPLLNGAGVDTTGFQPGVGIHRRPTTE